MNDNARINAALRTMAGIVPPAPVEAAAEVTNAVTPVAAPVATPAPKAPPANAGNGVGYVAPQRPDMNRWLRSGTYGRRQAEFITIGGITK